MIKNAKPTAVFAAGLTIILATVAIAVRWQMFGPRKRVGGESVERIVTADTISTTDDFRQALKRDRLILHVDVDWSFEAVQSRPLVLRFKELVQWRNWIYPFEFRRID